MNHQASNVSQPRPARVIASKLSLAAFVEYRIRKLRTTAQALSRKADVNPSVISKILNGVQSTMDDSNTEKLAKAMGVDWTELRRAMRNTRAQREEARRQVASV